MGQAKKEVMVLHRMSGRGALNRQQLFEVTGLANGTLDRILRTLVSNGLLGTDQTEQPQVWWLREANND